MNNTTHGYNLPPAEDWELLKVDNVENTHICDRATDKELTVPIYVTGHMALKAAVILQAYCEKREGNNCVQCPFREALSVCALNDIPAAYSLSDAEKKIKEVDYIVIHPDSDNPER